MPGGHGPLATSRRARRFSDSPCRCRLRFEPPCRREPLRSSGGVAKCLGCLGLHQRLVVLEAAKEELSNLAALQREELQYLNNRYELHYLAAESEELQQEKAQLEDQLKAFRSAPARLKSSRQAEAQHAAKREKWLAEKETLEAELAAASKQVAASREHLQLQRQQLSTAAQLRDELQRQRQQCATAEQELQTLQFGTQASRLPRQPPARPAPDALEKMRSELNSLAERRQQCSADLRSHKEELESLRRELAAISADNAQLRSGLRSVMTALDEVQRQL